MQNTTTTPEKPKTDETTKRDERCYCGLPKADCPWERLKAPRNETLLIVVSFDGLSDDEISTLNVLLRGVFV